MNTPRNRSLTDMMMISGAFILAGVYSLRRLSDSDLWLHLKCGEYFANHGAILKTYYFNCSWPEFPYLNHEWLFQAFIYRIFTWSGEAGLITLQVLLVLFSFFILCKILSLYSEKLSLISCVIALGVMASSHRFALRPQHFTYLFLAYSIYSLHQFQKGVRRYAWFLPLIMLVWVNMHAESLWGILVPLVFIVVEYLKPGLSPVHKEKGFTILACIIALTAAAALVNPFTYKTIVWPFIVMKEQFGGVEELLPPTGMRYLFFWIYFAVFVVSSLMNLKRADPTWLVLSLLFAAIALVANRGIPHFVFISAPVITASLENLLHTQKRSAGEPSFFARGLKSGLLLVMCLVILFVVTSPAYLKQHDNIPYPDGAINFLKKNTIRGNVFNDHIWGGYIVWTSYPDLKPYIDGRYFHRRFYDEFYAIREGREGWDTVLAKYDIRIALLRYNDQGHERLNDRLFVNPRWRLVYWDDVSLLYLRDDGGNRAVIEKFGNSLVNPDQQLIYEYENQSPEIIRKAQAIVDQNLKFANRSFKALIMSGNTHYALKDYSSARIRYLDALRSMKETNAWLLYKIALCYRNSGDLPHTKEYLEKALALAPDVEMVRRELQEVKFLLRT